MKLQIIAGFDACPQCGWPRRDGVCQGCDVAPPKLSEEEIAALLRQIEERDPNHAIYWPQKKGGG